jgi:hypothetical protein
MQPFVPSQNMNVSGVYNMYDADNGLFLLII